MRRFINKIDKPPSFWKFIAKISSCSRKIITQQV